ncbi:MAG: peptidase [Anaerolineae bacterium]|nr:peptidase [Anaerolineae bacterium]
MLSNALRLGRLFGIELKLDYSWFIIFVLMVWSLAGHYFPRVHPGWSYEIYWALGVMTALFFFASVVAHELAHSFVSQAQGVPVRDITLFIFGGVAHISQDPKSARNEFLMTLAGPAASLVMAILFGLIWLVSEPISPLLHALAAWLGWINLVLALFNLIPGFPLDGGRVFRAIVWSITGDLRRATLITVELGKVVTFGLIFWGMWQIFNGNWANGLWISFIGWFVANASAANYQRIALRELLAGHTVRKVMVTDCPHLLPRLTLDVVVDHVVLPSGRRCFPVMEQDQLRGLLTLRRIKEVPRARWTITRAEDVMIPLVELKTVQSDDDLATVFERMTAEDINQFPVIDASGRLVGMVARDNVLAFLHIRAVFNQQSRK